MMQSPPPLVLVTPERLTAATRLWFRAEGLKLVERADLLGVSVALDLSRTTSLDTSGIALLVLIHKRARERGKTVHLLNLAPDLRQQLVAVSLDHLFEYSDA